MTNVTGRVSLNYGIGVEVFVAIGVFEAGSVIVFVTLLAAYPLVITPSVWRLGAAAKTSTMQTVRIRDEVTTMARRLMLNRHRRRLIGAALFENNRLRVRDIQKEEDVVCVQEIGPHTRLRAGLRTNPFPNGEFSIGVFQKTSCHVN